MTKVLEILSKNKQKGIRIQLDESGLNLSLKGDLSLLSNEDKLELSQNKGEIIALLKGQVISQIPRIPMPEDGCVPLSSGQKAIWVACKMSESNDLYIIPAVFRRKVSNFNFQTFSQAVTEFVESNQILTYRFGEKGGEPYQQKIDFDIVRHLKFNEDTIGLSDKELQDLINIQSRESLSFDRFAPWNLSVYSLGNDEYCFHIRIHHLIADGTSLDLLVNGLMEQYAALIQSLPVTKPSLQFYEYVNWIEDKNNFVSSSQFWTNYLKNYPDLFEFTLSHQAKKGHTSGAVSVTIPRAEKSLIRDFLVTHNLSLSNVFTFAFGLVLSKHAMTSEVIIGTPSESRAHLELRSIIGNLVNTLPVRVKLNYEEVIIDELNSFKAEYLQVLDNQMYPFRQILDDINYIKSKSESDLFNALISFTNYQKSGASSDQELDLGNADVKFQIELSVFDFEDVIKLKLEYMEAIMSSDIANDLLQQITTTILQFVSNPRGKLSDIRLDKISKNQGETKVVSKPEPNEVANSLLELIGSIRQLHGDRTAIVDDHKNVSYNELWLRAQAIGDKLSVEGIGLNDTVVVELGPGFDLIASILGIWMTGSVYVPIGTMTPHGRKQEISQDCGSKLCIDQLWLNTVDETKSLELPISSAKHAYIIYTSGSSGVPKGVVVSQSALLNKLQEESQLLKLGKDSRTLTLTNPGFDVSFLEIILPLITGGTVIVSKNEKDLPQVYSLIENHDVNILQGTPSYFTSFLANLSNEIAIILDNKLSKICIGGESMNQELLFELKSKLPSVQINNHYGPTEATIDAVVNENIESYESNNIGKPLGRTKVFIVDVCDNILPATVPGELLIAGPSLAEGYWNNPELSAEKFDYCEKLKQRVYRTGDLVSWTREGDILFIGRKDRQLKFKGFRIELDEISSRIRQLEGVSEAHTEVFENILYAFYISESVEENEVKEHLKQFLPAYMVPSSCVCLAKMPLTPNGKIDLEALKAFKVRKADFKGPRNEYDEQLIRVWKDVLKKEEVGIEDNFFELGGTSMSLYKVFRQLSDLLLIEIELRDLLEHNTILEVSDYLKSREIERLTTKPIESGMTFPLASTQQRLWFYTSSDELSRIYNISIANKIEGLKLDTEILEVAFLKIQERHDALRARFKETDGKVELSFAQKNEGNFSVTEIGDNENPKVTLGRFSKEAYSFDGKPLVALRVLKETESTYYLFLGMHHIISDGISFQIFFEELYRYYFGLLKERDFTLPDLPYQYKDFIADEARLKIASEDFWKKKLSSKVYYSSYKPEFTVNTNKREGDSVVRSISKELIGQVTAYCNRLGVTDMALYQVVCASLSWNYYHQKNLIISSPTHGRVKSEWTNLIGYFVNIVPFTCDLDNSASFDSNVSAFHKANREILKYQLFSHTLLLEDKEIAKKQSAAGYNSVFDFVLSIADIDVLEVSGAAGTVHQIDEKVRIEQIALVDDTSKFDLNLIVQPGDEMYNLIVAFDANKYRNDAIVQFLEHVIATLELIVSNGADEIDKSLKQLNLEVPFNSPVLLANEVESSVRSEVLDLILENVLENWDRTKFVNYFERGGSSLKALELLGEIHTKTGTVISILDFYLNPSYEYLQEQLQDTKEVKESFKLNKLNETTETETAIVFFPPALGQSSLFGELASKFSGEHDCYGFDFLSENYLLNCSTNSIAADLAEAIDSLNYQQVILLGYSAGVNIAYSTAQSVKTQIQQLVFLDGLPNKSSDKWPGDNWFRTIWEQHIDASSIGALSEHQFQVAVSYSKKSMEFIPQNETLHEFCLFENEYSEELDTRMESWYAFNKQDKGDVMMLKGGHFNILDKANIEVIEKKMKAQIKKIISL